MGSGGAPEGVITAAAIRCLNGYMLGRLVINKPELEERIAKHGNQRQRSNLTKPQDLAPGKQLIFAATGVTDGALHEGRPLLRRRHPYLVGHHDAAIPAASASSKAFTLRKART